MADRERSEHPLGWIPMSDGGWVQAGATRKKNRVYFVNGRAIGVNRNEKTPRPDYRPKPQKPPASPSDASDASE